MNDLEVVVSRKPLVGDEMAPAIVLRPSAGGPFPALIGIHGQGGDKGRWVEMFRPLASQGILVILIDIRGHGGRRVAGLDPRGTIAALDYFRLCLGTVEDLRSLLDRVAARADVRPGPIGIWGHSMGGYIALAAAARDARLDPICAVGAWLPSMPLDAADYPESRPDPVELAEITEALDPVARVAALPDRRVLLLHGDQDDYAPVESVRHFRDALTAGYPDGPDAPMLLVYPGGHHPPSNIMSLARTWLARAMGGGREGS
ncbi:MAG: alpha/beta fold hydrolase [Chloroflexota bacterium]|nr:alpha/beta fold hydrolase [Chloroflexota bacterium]